MFADDGTHHHAAAALPTPGMTVTAKDVSIKAYPPLKDCDGYGDFLEALSGIVGTFGSTGKDPPQEELKKWLVL